DASNEDFSRHPPGRHLNVRGGVEEDDMANFYGSDPDEQVYSGFVNYYGGDGNDILQGDATPNQLYGGQGNDFLAGSVYTVLTGTGTPANPYVFSGFGASGDDYLEGGAGRDAIYAADGNDTIYGGDGDD